MARMRIIILYEGNMLMEKELENCMENLRQEN